MKEIWKDCKGFKDRYEVSNLGNIRNKKTTKLLKIYYGKSTKKGDAPGVLGIRINGKQTKLRIHRLVAETFIPNPQNKETVNHIDGDRKNNKAISLGTNGGHW